MPPKAKKPASAPAREMQLYGKTVERRRLSEMLRSQRIPHGIMLSGEKGLGKKTFAGWLAALFLCESPITDENGLAAPCLNCRCCSNIIKNEHADVIYVRDEQYKAENLREIIRSLSYYPNDGALRVIVLEDSEKMTDIQQNILLKAIEEPSSHNRFIFTCTDPALLLTTVRSRLVNIPVLPPSQQQTIQCLASKGIAEDIARQYTEMYGCNPGKIIELVQSKTGEEIFSAAENIITALLQKQEYPAAVEFSAIQDRETLFMILDILYSRLGAALTEDSGEKLLTGKLTKKQLYQLCDKLSELLQLKNTNVNLRLMQANVPAVLFDILR